jgi:hypothetical protein
MPQLIGRTERYLLRMFHSTLRNKHETVEANHLGTPVASAAAVLSRLTMLLAHSGLDH